MITLTHRFYKRLVSKMKNIIRAEIDEDFRQHVVEKAIVAAFDFDHMHAMLCSLPCDAEWDGDACVEYLHSSGFLSKEDAEQAVIWIEEDLPYLSGETVVRDIANDGGLAFAI